MALNENAEETQPLETTEPIPTADPAESETAAAAAAAPPADPIDVVDDASADAAQAPETEAEPEPEPEPAEQAPVPAPEPPSTPTPAAPPVPRPTVAQVIAAQLFSAGARFAFTVPGESFLGLLDALSDVGVRIIAARHEGGASFMAEAASQLLGKPQLVLGTRAVGASNMAIGIHTARADSSPMIALIGQVKRPFIGREAFQEADLVGSIGRLAKWAVQIDDPSRTSAVTSDAIARALAGRPGPVLISVPEDVLDKEVPGSWSSQFSPRVAATPDPDEVKAVLKLIAASQRGVILAGGGVLRSNASRRLMRLAEALAIPVIAAWRRPDAVANTHPLYLGMAGLAAASTVRRRLEEADVILVLGCRLNEITTFGYRIPTARQRWAHVDVEPREAGTGKDAPTLSLASDAGRFVDAALSFLREGVLDAENRSARLEAAARDREAYLAAAGAIAEPEWNGPGVNPAKVITALGRALPVEAVVTTDAGNFAGWLARGYRFRRPGTFLGPTSGAMGYGLPAAIAAALVYPRRPVVALAGDGGFAMTMSELETAVREGVAPIVLVFDNRRYGTIRMHQDREGRAASATDLGAIDFAAVARGLGADAFTVERDDEVAETIQAAMATGRPALIHLKVDPRWVSVDDPPATILAEPPPVEPAEPMAEPPAPLAEPASAAAPAPIEESMEAVDAEFDLVADVMVEEVVIVTGDDRDGDTPTDPFETTDDQSAAPSKESDIANAP